MTGSKLTRARETGIVMARYKAIDSSPRLLPVDLQAQLLAGTFEHALEVLIGQELDLSGFDARYCNDAVGASAYAPAVLRKAILFGYSRGLVSSRALERACRENVTFIALTRDTQPHFTTFAAFIRSSSEAIAQLFAQVLYRCGREGLIGREMFAIDGARRPSPRNPGRSGPAHVRSRKVRRRCYPVVPGAFAGAIEVFLSSVVARYA
jgi:transposase